MARATVRTQFNRSLVFAGQLPNVPPRDDIDTIDKKGSLSLPGSGRPHSQNGGPETALSNPARVFLCRGVEAGGGN